MTTEQDVFSMDHGLPSAIRAVDRPLPEAGFCHVAGTSLLSVTGDDALTFLQGQLTGDLRLLAAQDRIQLTAYCSQKGRCLAQFTVFPIQDGFLLQLAEDLADAVARRLKMFVMRSKVTLERADEQWVPLGIWGEEAAACVASNGHALPAEPFGCVSTGDRVVARFPGATPRFQLIVRAELAGALLGDLARVAEPQAPAAWRLAEIREGLPSINAATQELFLPQMLNLDLLGGIAFDKGCFVGQEVIARIKYLGKVKRRTYHALIDAEAAAGDRLESPDSKSGQGAGTVVDACRNELGRVEMLVAVEHAAARGTTTLGSDKGPILEITPPPYPLPEA